MISSSAHTGAPELSQQQVFGIVEPRHVDEPFGGAVDFLRRAAEALAQPAAQLRREAGAAVLDHLERRQVEALGHVGSEPAEISGTTAAIVVTRSRSTRPKTSAASPDGASTTVPP